MEYYIIFNQDNPSFFSHRISYLLFPLHEYIRRKKKLNFFRFVKKRNFLKVLKIKSLTTVGISCSC